MAIAKELGVEFDTVLYIKTPPDRAALEAIVAKLEDPVADLVRKDSMFAKLGLNEADFVTAGPVIDLLIKHKQLLQRPIVVTPKVAIVGRPKERIRALLGSL